MEYSIEIRTTRGFRYTHFLDNDIITEKNIIDCIIELPTYMRAILNNFIENRTEPISTFNFYTELQTDMTPHRRRLASMFGRDFVMTDNIEERIKEWWISDLGNDLRGGEIDTFRLRVNNKYVSQRRIKIS